MKRLLLPLLLLAALAAGQSVGVARMMEQAGQLDRALDEYRLVLERQPHDVGAYDGFRRVSVQLGQYDSLAAVSARLRGQMPNQVRYVLGEAEALFGLGRRKDALALCREAAGKWPNQVMMVVELLERSAEMSEAVALLVQQRESQGSHHLYGERLIDLYEKQGRYPEATREMVVLVNTNARLLGQYLPRLQEYGRKARTRRVLAELANLDDGWVEARARAEVLLGAGKEADALASARRAMGKDELYGFAHEAEEAGALNAALAVYQEQGLYPDQARVLRRMGRNAEALQVLGQDESPAGRFELAQLHRLELGDFGTAARYYGDVLKRRPGDANALYGLAASYVGMGELSKARETLGRVTRPADSTSMLMVRVLFYLGELDTCRAQALSLAQRTPNSMLVNDALELALLCGAGERATELGDAMMELEQGRSEVALAQARGLSSGEDVVAEHAWFLAAEASVASGRPKDALVELDSFVVRFDASPRRARARFRQAALLRDVLKDENAFRRKLEELVVDFPGSAYAPVARALLEEANRPVLPGEVH